jgi:hypothetical protein
MRKGRALQLPIRGSWWVKEQFVTVLDRSFRVSEARANRFEGAGQNIELAIPSLS